MGPTPLKLGSFPHRCTLVITISLFLSFSLHCFAVEDLTVDIPYPLTSPSALFPNIDRLKYIRSTTPVYVPSAVLGGEVDIDRAYNFELDGAYSFRSFKHHFGVHRNTLLEISNTKRYGMHSTFHLLADSLSLQYQESDWYSFVRSVYGISGALTRRGEGYTAALTSTFHRSDSLNDYAIEGRYHRFYGYANMLSFETVYRQSPYLLDRERSLLLTLRDRFAYSDFFFIIPGIRAEFLSQTYFTPLLNIVYLTSKHLSFALSAEGKALNNDVKEPYRLPFLFRSDSLEVPLNIFSAALETNVIIDTLSVATARFGVRKTEHPIIAFDHQRYFLRQGNLDTTVIYYDATLHLLLSRSLFNLDASLTTSSTPFHEETLPYTPDYTYCLQVFLKPLRQITIGGALKGTGIMFSSEGVAIDKHHLLSASLKLHPLRYCSISINSINTTNWRGCFMNNVFYPGRIITSGVTIQF